MSARSRRRGTNEQARSRRLRETRSMSNAQVTGLIEAARHAQRIGLPFNRHITVRLEKAGVEDRDGVQAIGKFLTRIRDWLRRKGLRTSYAWAREWAYSTGSHVHILLHLPPEVTLRGSRTRRWIEAISGQPYEAGTICTRRIAQSAYDQNLAALVGYLCKGASADVADSLGLTRRKYGGAVIGKRAGWSQNIGKKARLLWRLGTK